MERGAEKPWGSHEQRVGPGGDRLTGQWLPGQYYIGLDGSRCDFINPSVLAVEGE